MGACFQAHSVGSGLKTCFHCSVHPPRACSAKRSHNLEINFANPVISTTIIQSLNSTHSLNLPPFSILYNSNRILYDFELLIRKHRTSVNISLNSVFKFSHQVFTSNLFFVVVASVDLVCRLYSTSVSLSKPEAHRTLFENCLSGKD